MYRTEFWTLWEKARVGCFERTALKHVYNLGWNRSPAQVGCMRQVLRPGALGRPRGIGWRGWWEGGSGWGIHVNPWLIHVNVWQKPLQYCKVISLQLIKISGKKKKRTLSELPLFYSREYKYELQMCLCMYQNSLLLTFWKYQWNKKYRLVIHANLVFIFLLSQSRGLTTFLQADSEYWDQCYGKSSVEMRNTQVHHW